MVGPFFAHCACAVDITTGKMGSATKHVKKPNFSDKELDVIVEEVSLESTLLMSSFQNGVTNQKKKAVWSRITEKVNAVGGNGRTIDQVRKRWKDMKQDCLRHRQVAGGTGGGPPVPPPPYADVVLTIIGQNTGLVDGIPEVGDVTDTWQAVMPEERAPQQDTPVSFVTDIQDMDDITVPGGTTVQTLDLALPATPPPAVPTAPPTTHETPSSSPPESLSTAVMKAAKKK